MATKALMGWLSLHNGGWILEIDLRKFFDTIPHDQLLQVLSQKIGDKVALHLIQSWLKAGVLIDGQVMTFDIGAPQGGVISPLCANVYLDTGLDQWPVRELQPKLKGESLLVRYADDFVLAFNDQDDMESVGKAIIPRLERYGLAVNAKKSRTVDMRKPEGDNPNLTETHIDFLGFTYYWKPCPYSGWKLAIKTSDKSIKRFTDKIEALVKDNGNIAYDELEVAIQSMVRGHKCYFDIEGNEDMLSKIEHIALSYLYLYPDSVSVEMSETTAPRCIWFQENQGA
jgi:group II intron reverse transcriptase/maturase